MPVFIPCDTAHRIVREEPETLVFDKGADSVDSALVNRVSPEDIMVTQDYGLASMCLACRTRMLNHNGLECTADNIDALLERHRQNKKLLRAGKRPKGPTKRTKSRMRRSRSWWRNCREAAPRCERKGGRAVEAFLASGKRECVFPAAEPDVPVV